MGREWGTALMRGNEKKSMWRIDIRWARKSVRAAMGEGVPRGRAAPKRAAPVWIELLQEIYCFRGCVRAGTDGRGCVAPELHRKVADYAPRHYDICACVLLLCLLVCLCTNVDRIWNLKFWKNNLTSNTSTQGINRHAHENQVIRPRSVLGGRPRGDAPGVRGGGQTISEGYQSRAGERDGFRSEGDVGGTDERGIGNYR